MFRKSVILVCLVVCAIVEFPAVKSEYECVPYEVPATEAPTEAPATDAPIAVFRSVRSDSSKRKDTGGPRADQRSLLIIFDTTGEKYFMTQINWALKNE